MLTFEKDISFSNTEEMKQHIISWFFGTEYAIEKISDIQEPKIVGNTISFWYNNMLCNCPVRKRDETDIVSLSPS